MSKSITEAVLCALKPKTYYRAKDIQLGGGVSDTSIYSALRELSRGGVIEAIKDGKRTLYLTRQESLI